MQLWPMSAATWDRSPLVMSWSGGSGSISFRAGAGGADWPMTYLNRLNRNNLQAMMRSSPGLYEGRVTLFRSAARADSDAETYRWYVGHTKQRNAVRRLMEQ